MKTKFLAFLLGTVLVAPSAFAQLQYPTTNTVLIPGAAILVPNAAGTTGAGGQPIYVPPSATNPFPVVPVAPAAGTNIGTVTIAPQSYTAVGCPAAAPTCGTNQAGFTIASSAAHAASDVVGAAAGALTFANLCPAAGREVIITSTRLRYDASAVPSGMTSFRLWLYSVTPPSAYADDAPWQMLVGDRPSSLGYIDLGSPVLPSPGSTSLVVETNGNQKQITCGASTSVFGYFITNGAFTTAAETVFLQVKAVAP